MARRSDTGSPSHSGDMKTSPRPSLARNSVARFTADASALVFGSVATIVTARALGPSGQGVFASIFLLAAIGVRLCSVGLGETAIVRVGQGVVTRQEGLSATLAGVLAAGAIGVLPFFGLATLIIGPDDSNTWLALVAATAFLPLGAVYDALSQTLNGQERLVATSRTLIAIAGLTLLGLVVFVVVLDLDVFGGALSGLCATAVGTLVMALLLARSGLSLKPRWNRDYLVNASRYGVRLQGSQILTLAAGRADLLLVLALLGDDDAGHYSVALTVGTLAGLGSFAMSYAIFPRLPTLDREAALSLAARAARLGLASSLIAAIALAAVIPLALPVLFGSEYQSSVGPGLLLIVAGIPLSGQWMLGRSAAALGDPNLLARSFAVSLGVMVVLDLGLLPVAGLYGAASASLGSSVAGLIVCIRAYHANGLNLSDLLPRPSDCADVGRGLLRLRSPAIAEPSG